MLLGISSVRLKQIFVKIFYRFYVLMSTREREKGKRNIATGGRMTHRERKSLKKRSGISCQDRERPWAAPSCGFTASLLDSGKEAGTTPVWKPQGPSRRRVWRGSQT